MVRVGDTNGVYVANGDTAKFVPVRTGLDDNGRTEVVSGLSDKDAVVVEGQSLLRPGAKISVSRAKE